MKEVIEQSDDTVTVAEEATIADAATPKKSRIALIGIKKGAAAAKLAAAKVATAPGRLFDKAVYGACYGVSYGTVFTSLMIARVLPSDSVAMKGLHEGAEFARKDFESRQEKHLNPQDPSVIDISE